MIRCQVIFQDFPIMKNTPLRPESWFPADQAVPFRDLPQLPPTLPGNIFALGKLIFNWWPARFHANANPGVTSHRCRISSTYFGLSSIRIALRPSSSATAPVVPLPAKGSRTVQGEISGNSRSLSVTSPQRICRVGFKMESRRLRPSVSWTILVSLGLLQPSHLEIQLQPGKDGWFCLSNPQTHGNL